MYFIFLLNVKYFQVKCIIRTKTLICKIIKRSEPQDSAQLE